MRRASRHLRSELKIGEKLLLFMEAGQVLKVEAVMSSLIASLKVHSIQTVKGDVWICKDSLFLEATVVHQQRR